MLRKKENLTICAPIPGFVPRQLALDVLHNHSEVITLNPLVIDHTQINPPKYAKADEYYCTWYEITERIQWVPGMGKMGAGKISFAGCFHNLPWGLQTHTYAPMDVELRHTYRIAGNAPGTEPEERPEIGLSSIGAPTEGLYLRADMEFKCNFTFVSFVRSQLKAAIQEMIARMIKRAEELDADMLQRMLEEDKSPMSPVKDNEFSAAPAGFNFQDIPKSNSTGNANTQSVPVGQPAAFASQNTVDSTGNVDARGLQVDPQGAFNLRNRSHSTGGASTDGLRADPYGASNPMNSTRNTTSDSLQVRPAFNPRHSTGGFATESLQADPYATSDPRNPRFSTASAGDEVLQVNPYALSNSRDTGSSYGSALPEPLRVDTQASSSSQRSARNVANESRPADPYSLSNYRDTRNSVGSTAPESLRGDPYAGYAQRPISSEKYPVDPYASSNPQNAGNFVGSANPATLQVDPHARDPSATRVWSYDGDASQPHGPESYRSRYYK